MKERGGKTVYGACIGILMLEARFPRIPGDMGNGLTWPFPVQYRVVAQASPDRVVRHQGAGLLPAFVEAARDLVKHGADGITTNCGFLSLFQHELADAVGVPVATSSLMQVPFVERMLPKGQRVGILTISRETLSERHLVAAGVDPSTPVHGTDDGREFTRAILGNELELDVEAARHDNVEAAERLVAMHPDIGAIVLECTNMIPYAADIRRATGRPVFSIYNLVTWFQASLLPPEFGGRLNDARPG